MPNIFHQSVEDILRAATPEQRLLWNYVFLRWGERVPIAQLFYEGASPGSEFLTYNANKLYLAYSLELGRNVAPNVGASLAYCELYNESNAMFHCLMKSVGYWDATAAAARFSPITISSNNFYFSRLVLNGYASIKFIGYRIAI